MGEAMLAAVLDKELAEPADISVSDISEERRDYLKNRYKIAVTDNNRAAVQDKDIIVMAIKPQNIAEVMDGLKARLDPEQLVISIAAGIKIKTISHGLAQSRIVRVMPNTPAQIGLGMSGWTATDEVTEEQKEWSQSILSAMGREIYFEDEEELDMVTAVSASGPAYVFLFTEALTEAAMDIGLTQIDAEELVSQMMLGSVELMQKSGRTPAELRVAVTSKGGTTERALQVFKEGGLAGLVRDAVKAAYIRSRELGS